MKIHHFYPKTCNIGDHLVRAGIERLFKEISPGAEFTFFNINRRGDDKVDYGLTQHSVDRANKEADLVVVGGSNLYEGHDKWGVHLDLDALSKLRVPLFLVGIGTGSSFRAATPTQPSPQVLEEIKALNGKATFSGVRDVVTYKHMKQLGIINCVLMGDPATFVFNRPFQWRKKGYVLVIMSPIRFLRTGRWKIIDLVDWRARAMFRSFRRLVPYLLTQGCEVVVGCNDPRDLVHARHWFRGRAVDIRLPQSVSDYWQLLAGARAVISDRLHTAVTAFSLGLPFILINVDQRTQGFVDTYGTTNWSVVPSRFGFHKRLIRLVDKLLQEDVSCEWQNLIEKRDKMYITALGLLSDALASVGLIK